MSAKFTHMTCFWHLGPLTRKSSTMKEVSLVYLGPCSFSFRWLGPSYPELSPSLGQGLSFPLPDVSSSAEELKLLI